MPRHSKKRRRSDSTDREGREDVTRILKRLERRLDKVERRCRKNSPSPGEFSVRKRQKGADSPPPTAGLSESDLEGEDIFTHKGSSIMESDNEQRAQDNGHLSETLDVNTVPVPGESDSILSILGDDQNEQNMFSDPIQPEIASRWAKVLKNGLPQDTKQDLIKKYLPPQNCCEVSPPKMNPEVKTAVAENTIRRDIRLAQLQEQVGAAISAIGYTLTSMLQEKEGANKKYIEVLNNAGRLLSDVHYCESVSRRELLGINLNKDLKDTLKNTQISDLLFGSDLDNTIRTAKDLEKSSEQLKAQKKSTQPSNHSITSKQGNFRRPFPQKTGVQRTGQIFRAPTNQRRPYVNQRYQQKRQDRHQPRNDRKRHQY